MAWRARSRVAEVGSDIELGFIGETRNLGAVFVLDECISIYLIRGYHIYKLEALEHLLNTRTYTWSGFQHRKVKENVNVPTQNSITLIIT